MSDEAWQFTLSRLLEELPRFAFRFRDEVQLHDGISEALTSIGIAHQREYVAGPSDRFDFLCGPGLVIEVKVHGGFADAVRQVDRYCERPDVNAAVLVTTRAWRVTEPLKLHGKPVHVIRVGGQAF